MRKFYGGNLAARQYNAIQHNTITIQCNKLQLIINYTMHYNTKQHAIQYNVATSAAATAAAFIRFIGLPSQLQCQCNAIQYNTTPDIYYNTMH